MRMCMSSLNSKHGSFLFLNNEIIYQNGRALMEMHIVILIMNRGNYVFKFQNGVISK